MGCRSIRSLRKRGLSHPAFDGRVAVQPMRWRELNVHDLARERPRPASWGSRRPAMQSRGGARLGGTSNLIIGGGTATPDGLRAAPALHLGPN